MKYLISLLILLLAFGQISAQNTGVINDPNDIALIIEESGHFLTQNKVNELIGKLEMAIEKEPDNISLYIVLGNFFVRLYEKEADEGNKAKSTEYFNNALSRFNQALSKDSEYIDAIYSIGALHYNNAAFLQMELQQLEEDFSQEGLEKYEAKNDEILQKFDEALPFFQRCEKLNPNDLNTLTALREIYARKNDLIIFNEFKGRLEKVLNGGKNEFSFFQE
ncbi:MAG: hypothetical protein AAF363_12885 [Bacteroidota bacterium]